VSRTNDRSREDNQEPKEKIFNQAQDSYQEQFVQESRSSTSMK
jgi:hypothetical protein